MKNRILLKTNLMVCLVIAAGFLLTAVFSYRLNYSASLESIEQVSQLTSEGIYHQMNNILSKPVNVSQTMANDSLLKDILLQESGRLEDPDYIEVLQEYLQAYQKKYGYDSVFLVSAATARYYNFNGLDRVLEPDDPENKWYYDVLLPSDAEYAMNVDNDEVANAENAITLFVNCKIKDGAGKLLGVVGVGVRIDQLQSILQKYQDNFRLTPYFIDEEGVIELSVEHTGYDPVNLFDTSGRQDAKEDILNWKDDDSAISFWDLNPAGRKRDYIVSRYLPEIGWHLVVERDTSELIRTLNRQMTIAVVVIIVIIAVILFIITRVIQSFNRKIVVLERACEQERKSMFEKATNQLFEDIYELDVTHNRPANQVTERYFESLGAPAGTPYDKALSIIAEKQIMPEFRQGYLKTFSPQNVLEGFRQGRESLSYDFMISNDSVNYYWMRITARLILSESDGSLHMLVYRQNIDAEKKQEQRMLELARTDEMTGLLNKAATQKLVEKRLEEAPERLSAFFIFDIDHFKDANDFFGHAFGDKVICSFTGILRENFRRGDLLGRIGGDEFAAFLPVSDVAWAAKKARELNMLLDRDYVDGNNRWHMSASIGVAFSPRDGIHFDTLYQKADAALYETKKRGRGSFTLYRGIAGGQYEDN
ncbi:diguanylate cyclase [Lactonifactor longoviformis]|uniref:sensor domain-containing diguanylate cyclase n=1 Tax=Lactonifactor longoviformis TaxID=341220 RepID=UPI0036F40B87